MAGDTVSLFARDLALWSEEQAQILRQLVDRGTNVTADWANIIEEIVALGSAQREGLSSRIGTILEHLLKLQLSPAIDPRRGWREAIRRSRVEIRRIVRRSPSLAAEIPQMLADELPEARSLVRATLADHGEEPLLDPNSIAISEAQLLGDWLPD